MIVMLPPNLHRQADSSPDNKLHVLQACRAMLRPIVRMLLKSGIVHRVFLNLTREVYIDVARTEFGLRGRTTSISRTALLTGLARKEVRRITNLMDSGENADYEPTRQDRITRVLSGWFQDKDYMTTDGHPLAIRIDGLAPSFADLKSRYGGDIPASAILRELLSCGTIEKTEEGLVQPVYRNYAPNPMEPEHLLRAGSAMQDFGTTVIRNLYREDNDMKWLERRATNTDFPERLLPEFSAMLNVEGQRFLERVDAWMSEHEDKTEAQTKIRVGLGMYIIKGQEDDN